MEFFDKQKDVINIQVTGYGKQLLSRGLFKPAYYAFSDDGVLYDSNWMSGTLETEKQSAIEPRIQENTPRLETQYRKAGAERKIFGHNPNLFLDQENIFDLFEFANEQEYQDNILKILLTEDFAESEKLLENVLGSKQPFDQYNPAWSALFYHGEISSTTAFYKKNDIVKLVPQLNCTLSDTAYKLELESDTTPAEVLSEVKNISDKFGGAEPHDFFESLPLIDGGQIYIIKDFLFVSLEESSVDFTNDNFMVEVFEITETSKENSGEEKLEKLIFAEESGITPLNWLPCVEHVFSITVDEQVDNDIACYLIGKDKDLRTQNIYLAKIYDCALPPDDQLVTADPYTSLPEVNVEDVC